MFFKGVAEGIFGLACNLIRRIISPNQDDLSHSSRFLSRAAEIWEAAKHTLFTWTTPPSADLSLAALQ